jgi:hypothetical protein
MKLKLYAPLSTVALDVAGLVGVGLVSYGAWLAYRPAGFIIGGALLIAAAVLLARGE